MSLQLRLGLIGSGNMGTAIIEGVISKHILEPNQIYASDVNHIRLKELESAYGIYTLLDNKEIIRQSDIIVLAVKPDRCMTVLDEIRDDLHDRKGLVSIVAGLTTHSLRSRLNDDARILRVMPNTPALVGEGMTVFSKDHNLLDDQIDLLQQIFSALGKVEMVEERLMDVVTALSGSGPAFVYLFIEALADAGVLEGLSRDLSYKLAAQTVLGSAKMVLETGNHPAELKDKVCSPGGTTIEGIYVLEQRGFRAGIMDAVLKSTQKSKMLSGKTNDKAYEILDKK
ncbi:MAG: pyrroline-5-carboxylate reductase [Clostridia bacterium]|jgi:pyrroline-5-carboxylate reductase